MNAEQVIIISKMPLQLMPADSSKAPFSYASFSKSAKQYASAETQSINNGDPLSFGGWFKLREASSEGPLTVCGWSQSGNWGSTHILRGSYRIGTGSIASNFSIPAIELDVWHHLVVSYDGTAVKFYKDGQAIHEILFSQARINNASQFRISSFNEGSVKYSSVDASRVFIVARGLSQEDVMQLMNARKLTTRLPCLAESTLVNAWNIDEGSGTVFSSICQTKSSMTVYNGCTWKIED